MIKIHNSYNGLRSIWIVLAVLLLLLGFSCSESTSPKTGKLSGRVVLVNDTGDTSLDPVDFSGVTVALYELAVLDSSIVRINQEYPHIGVQISQETEFDHRLQNPVAVVISDADGNYEFTKIPYGDYNLSVMKQGWGFRYLYNIEVTDSRSDNTLRFISPQGSTPQEQSSSNNHNNSRRQVTLYPETSLAQTVASSIIFKQDHVYLAPSDVTVLSDVVIEGGTVIALAEGTRIVFHGNVTYEGTGKFVRFTSHDSVDSLPSGHRVEPKLFDKAFFNGSYDYNLSNVIFEYSMNGFGVGGGSFSLSQSILRRNGAVALEASSVSGDLMNVLFVLNPHVAISSSSPIDVIKSILCGSREAITIQMADSTIKNSYFCDNWIALRFLMGEPSITNNAFDRNTYAISPCASDPYIAYNNFYNNVQDIETNRYWGGTHVFCNPTVSFNNFFSSRFYVNLFGRNSYYAGTSGSGVLQNQIYPNNYLMATDIQNHIFDANYPDSGIDYSVSFTPRFTSRVQSAGLTQ